MSKLWTQDETSQRTTADASVSALKERIHRFTADADRQMDLELARWDILGSIAHVTMLGSTGILSSQDVERLIPELRQLLTRAEQGTIQIEEGVEDIHSQIELMLTRTLGETGKRIHAARSRNDQVLTDLRLWIRHRLLTMTDTVLALAELLLELSERHKEALMPGYTHMQVAMPSSFGLWFASWAEGLGEDLWSLHGAMKVINRNPLGSAAGYGSSFPIDREETSRELGFTSPVWNSIAAQNGRGKSERIAAFALASVASTLGRMSHDLVVFQSQNFGFFSFPAELTTGSSIMPHKRNPDVFELIRGRCNRIQALPNEIAMILANLNSGYHRDFQLVKEHLFPAFNALQECMEMATEMLRHVSVPKGLLDDPRYRDVFTVEAVQEKVRSGVPFRDAYHAVAQEVKGGTFRWEKPLNHTHQGSIGNLCNDRILEEIRQTVAQIRIAGGS